MIVGACARFMLIKGCKSLQFLEKDAQTVCPEGLCKKEAIFFLIDCYRYFIYVIVTVVYTSGKRHSVMYAR